MHAYIHACIHACMHAHLILLHACIYIHIYVCLFICIGHCSGLKDIFVASSASKINNTETVDPKETAAADCGVNAANAAGKTSRIYQ